MRGLEETCVAALLATVCTAGAVGGERDEGLALDVHGWRLVESESGDVNYYQVVDEKDRPYIHAAYKPPWESAVYGIEIGDRARTWARRLRWSWRALTLPRDGNECVSGYHDSAATVYVSWKRGLRWFALKYVWSTKAAKDAICDRKRNPFLAQEVIVLETGGPTGVWKTEEIDLDAEFRKHFADGDPKASVPNLRGIAVMSDGDSTKSESSADFADFILLK